MRIPGDETSELTAGDPATPLCLVVENDGVRHVFRLEDGVDMTIGRSSDATIRVDHPSVSRSHAVIRVVAGRVQLCDAGSANGTYVRGEAVGQSWRALEVGAVIELGQVLSVLRRVSSAPPRRVWPHGYFEGRVEEEAARCARNGRTFAVLRINVGSSGSSAEEVLAALLRAHDVLALYAPGELEVLLSEIEPDEAEAIAMRLAARLQRHGMSPRLGVACFPRDASSPAELLAHANAAVRGERHDAPTTDRSASRSLGAVEALIDQVAPGTISVLLLGETGVGKEVTAEKIHLRSRRASATFLRLHCGALTESLLESELFGHERGAFTGAVAAKPGLIESADGGTVFLDEIGELPMTIQVKLLRVLDDRQVMRVGGLRPRVVDVRFVAATNRDLEAEVAAGRFRKDLYFRLAGVTIEIPPLRERQDEILPLARTMAARAAKSNGSPVVPSISAAAASALERYPWPGNVRELRNVIERALLLSGGDEIGPEHLPLDKMSATVRPQVMAREAAAPEPRASRATGRIERVSLEDDVTDSRSALRTDLANLERERILDALARCAGNQSAAARMLEMPRGTLVARLNEYGIPRPRKPRP